MSARVLVVDDVLPNVKVLEAKLSSEYFDVITASSGQEALQKVYQENPDIVLLDVMMPGMNGFEVCRQIKNDPRVAHIPVVMVTALSEPRDRVEGIEAGADDFLTKPVNDTALFARVRSLVRLKMMMDELRLREQTGSEIGYLGGLQTEQTIDASDACILMIDESGHDLIKVRDTLSGPFEVLTETTPAEAVARASKGNMDLVIISLAAETFDPLRLCVQLRNTDETRQLPILILVEEMETDRLAKALEIGVTDYLVRPIDRNELLARTRTQIRRKRYQDLLRSNVHESMTLAMTDSLTGLHNRRYFTSYLDNSVSGAIEGGKSLSLLMLDIDHFKRVNDTYGHAAGDEVLRQFAERVTRCVRGVDLAARIGGEEFVVVLPDTDLDVAVKVAERLRRTVASEPVIINDGADELSVACSIGVTAYAADESAERMLKRADDALYTAKRQGRNRVVVFDGEGREIQSVTVAASA